MRTLVIVAHPNLQAGSRVNRRLADRLLQAEAVSIHDLYRACPNGAIDVEREQKLLLAHDRVLFQFPFWWYSSPALLKRWFDEVLTYGWAFGPGGDKLKGKEWGMVIMAGSPEESYHRGGYNKYTMEELTRPFEATANLIGAAYLPVFAMTGVLGRTDEELDEWAERYVKYAAAPYPFRREDAAVGLEPERRPVKSV